MATKRSEDKSIPVSSKPRKTATRKTSNSAAAAKKSTSRKSKREMAELQVDEVHDYVIVSKNGLPTLTPTQLALLGTFLDELKVLGVISVCEKPGG